MASTALWPNPRETWISAEKCRHTYAGRTIDHFQDPYTRVDEKFVGISGSFQNPFLPYGKSYGYPYGYSHGYLWLYGVLEGPQ